MMRRLREKRTGHHDPAQLNLIPLIDVLFNLLIFVLASASVAAVGELPVDRPASSSAQETDTEPVVVSITADLSFAVGGTPVSFDALEDAVARALDLSPARAVVFHADRSVPTGVLVDLYDAAARAGADKISIASEPGR